MVTLPREPSSLGQILINTLEGGDVFFRFSTSVSDLTTAKGIEPTAVVVATWNEVAPFTSSEAPLP